MASKAAPPAALYGRIPDILQAARANAARTRTNAVVRYTLGEQQEHNVFASRYQLYLPTVEELQRELVSEGRQIVPAEPAKPAAKRRTTQKKVEGKKR